MRVLAALSLLAFPAMIGLAAARDQVPAENRDIPWTGIIPACDDPSVLGEITRRFTRTQSNFWDSALTIDGFAKIRPVAVRPWGLDYIPRRFCTGEALVSDGHKRQVTYSVREDLGNIGATWDVQWCVTGLDRNLAYAPHCAAAGP